MSEGFDKSTGFFTAFRQDYGFPYFHKDDTTYLLRDLGLWVAVIAYILAVLVLTVILTFLGTRGYSRWRVALQMLISLSLGVSILGSVFYLLTVAVTGHGWQRSDYEMSYVGGRKETYMVRVGLYQANITMSAMNATDRTPLEFHNVKIGWNRIDQAEMEYNEALKSGWPLGILRIAHYLSIDVGDMRYMRSFRWSGYIASVLLWFAFASWLLANAIMTSNISVAAGALLITGGVQIITCIVYHHLQPANFAVPLDDGSGNVLRLGYDWMYWLTCFAGIFGVLLAIILLILNYLRPADMNKFFGTHSEILSPYDEELKMNKNKDIRGLIRGISMKRSLRKKVSIDSEAKTIPDRSSLKHRGRKGRKESADATGYLGEVDTPMQESKRPDYLQLKQLNADDSDLTPSEQKYPVQVQIEITTPTSANADKQEIPDVNKPSSPDMAKEGDPETSKQDNPESQHNSSGSEGSRSPLLGESDPFSKTGKKGSSGLDCNKPTGSDDVKDTETDDFDKRNSKVLETKVE